MKLLFTYDDRAQGELALAKIVGEKRLASERDGTLTVYNLFGVPSWGNFYRLELFDLREFEGIVKLRVNNNPYDKSRFQTILITLQYVAKQYNLELPAHWV